MKKLILATQYHGLSMACYWNSLTKNIILISPPHKLTLFTCFGFKSNYKALQVSPKITIEMHFRKLSKEKIAVIMLKIKGVLLKAQAIDIYSGNKIPLTAIGYKQLVKAY